MTKKFRVPIYDVDVHLFCSRNTQRDRQSLEFIFGPAPKGGWGALCSYSAGEFGLFFDQKSLSVSLIGHEVFHLTHRILEWAGVGFDAQHHEAAAHLHGYLLSEVQRRLKRHMQE